MLTMIRSQRYAYISLESDGKMCVVRVRASPPPYNTAPYSPSAQRHLALRGHCRCRDLSINSWSYVMKNDRAPKGEPDRTSREVPVASCCD